MGARRQEGGRRGPCCPPFFFILRTQSFSEPLQSRARGGLWPACLYAADGDPPGLPLAQQAEVQLGHQLLAPLLEQLVPL